MKMNSELVMMIILVIALIFGNLWLLKRNSKSFAAKRKTTAPVSQTRKKANAEATVNDGATPPQKPTNSPQNQDDSSGQDGGGGD